MNETGVAKIEKSMELIAPADVYLDQGTTTMWNDVDELARQVNEIRPLKPEVLRQVKEELFAERVFSSNAIEGNTLTIRETRLILQTRSFLDVRRKREAQEALNLGEASSRMERLLEVEGAWHDISNFLAVHEILMKGVNNSIAGAIRNRDVMITGAKHQPPGSMEASDLTEKILLHLAKSENIHGLALATWVHWAIARVHPFEDGNGRMARLWQDLILLRSRLTVAIIRPQERVTYLDALVKADDNNYNPLAQLICQRVMSTFQIYLNAQQAADELQGWASELTGETHVRESEKRHLAYQRWRHAVEQVRDAFERCAALINKGADRTLEVQVQPYEVIDQATWESLLSGAAGKKTWFFKVWFRKNQRVVWYYFFFGRHLWYQEDAAIGEDGPWVNIIVSQQYPDEPKAISLDEVENTRISLRELFVVEKRIVRRRLDATTSQVVYDLDKTPITVAKEFFEEVLLKELI
jgi:Fic family protein